MVRIEKIDSIGSVGHVKHATRASSEQKFNGESPWMSIRYGVQEVHYNRYSSAYSHCQQTMDSEITRSESFS